MGKALTSLTVQSGCPLPSRRPALCLGARGVGIGRGLPYPLGAYGQPGVESAVQLLQEELERGMRLLGVRTWASCMLAWSRPTAWLRTRGITSTVLERRSTNHSR
ncbi:hypothetical protein VDGD_21717 [Verticillium dahliae]|nr:hypothetical protein VDGD_21717 [Verticillium dahliae]